MIGFNFSFIHNSLKHDFITKNCSFKSTFKLMDALLSSVLGIVQGFFFILT